MFHKLCIIEQCRQRHIIAQFLPIYNMESEARFEEPGIAIGFRAIGAYSCLAKSYLIKTTNAAQNPSL
jgi:hypothetical protein